MRPVKINVENNSLQINWNDESKSTIKLSNLRRYCPCALCVNERENDDGSYIPIYTNEELKISNIELSGNYALHIQWKDGHDAGFYEFNYLMKLSEAEKNK